ncbi:hypothetical protein C2S51_000495 [Perilla frutescens var. frutescens]|nr:hypothetical protein C2S51_000495 [Perilla frutescens var. frutescens]
MTTTVLETCGIQPPSCAADELSVPLSFFDILWVHSSSPVRRLIFYEHPCSNADFFETIIPKLKQSLSLTLKHYLPAPGNLLYPRDMENKPVIRYISGDSVPLTIAVSGCDFDDLTGDHARDSDQFYDFMPQMPPLIEEAEYKIVPLMALQVTLFSGRGICIGLSNHHCLGDARSIVGFMSAWASINRSGGDEEFLSGNGDSLPLFDRRVFGDSGRIDDIYWNVMKGIPLNPPSSFPLPTKKVRASFTLRQTDITKLKNLVLSEDPSVVRVSSFVVTVAYIWSCLVKSGGVEAGENVDEMLIFPADGRGRPNALFDPPVPVNYFGNCLGGGVVSVERKDLAADDGFLVAAAAIVDEMNKKIYNKEEFLSGQEKIVSEMRKYANMRMFNVTGSPKFDLTNGDFGWGKARKVENLSLDLKEYAITLSNSGGDGGGGLVVGMSLPKERMETFAAIFADGLNN